MMPALQAKPDAVLAYSNFVRMDGGGFCEEFKRPGGDDPFMWLMARERGPFVYAPEPLLYYRETPLAAVADKYAAGLPIGERSMRERYGRRARRLIRDSYRFEAALVVVKALSQMEKGDYASAFETWMRAARLSPGYLTTPKIVSRAVQPRNLRRVANLLRPGKLKPLHPATGASYLEAHS